MAKKNVVALVKIQIPAGQASPAPPVGTALGPHGIAIMDFCKEYNAKTEDKRGTIIPVEISIYEDRTFSFITKTPPAPVLQGRLGDDEAGRGHREAEDARLELRFDRVGGPHGGRYRAVNGFGRRRISAASGFSRTVGAGQSG